MLGFDRIKVEWPEEVSPAWDRDLRESSPLLVELRTAPQIVALPAHVEPAIGREDRDVLTHGDEGAVGTATERFERKLSEVAEHV